METYDIASELEGLLEKIEERGVPLKMPKQKPHWKQLRKQRQERDRRVRAQPGQVAYRKRLTRSLRRKYNESKRVHTSRGHEWDLSFDDWAFAWICCPLVNGAPAWYQTGRGKGKVRAERINKDKGWSKDNLMIVHGKNVLYPK